MFDILEVFTPLETFNNRSSEVSSSEPFLDHLTVEISLRCVCLIHLSLSFAWLHNQKHNEVSRKSKACKSCMWCACVKNDGGEGGSSMASMSEPGLASAGLYCGDADYHYDACWSSIEAPRRQIPFTDALSFCCTFPPPLSHHRAFDRTTHVATRNLDVSIALGWTSSPLPHLHVHSTLQSPYSPVDWRAQPWLTSDSTAA